MTDEEKPDDRRGTIWDWPVGVTIAGVVLAVLAASNSAPAGILLGFVLVAFGVVALLARRGSFSPRRR